MKYARIYGQLCRQALTRATPPINCEKHHVFPVSIFGENSFVVSFSYREHYVAHRLLLKICSSRYGESHINTRKMAMAVHKMVHGTNPIRLLSLKTSLMYETARTAVKIAKLGAPRKDMYGKKYFGASPEKIESIIEKVRLSKTGKKINYPKNRKSSPRTESTITKIKNTKASSTPTYLTMTNQQFIDWVNCHKLFMSDGRKNGNITKAIIARSENIGDYYND